MPLATVNSVAKDSRFTGNFRGSDGKWGAIGGVSTRLVKSGMEGPRPRAIDRGPSPPTAPPEIPRNCPHGPSCQLMIVEFRENFGKGQEIFQISFDGTGSFRAFDTKDTMQSIAEHICHFLRVMVQFQFAKIGNNTTILFLVKTAN